MICKACICHKDSMKPERIYGKNLIWCMRWKGPRRWSEACPYLGSVCGDCEKCKEEARER